MKSLRNYLIIFLALAIPLSVYIPFRYQIAYPKDIRPQFDASIRNTYIRILDEEQPDVFLLGDSMLAPAVDAASVADALDKKVYLTSLSGTASTIWYVMIKNNIVVAEHKPEYLVVFFRDTMMTVPAYRVTGRYFELVDEYAGPDDEVLIQRSYVEQMNPLEKLAERYFPLYSTRWKIRQSIDYHIRYTPAAYLLGCDDACMDAAMGKVFEETSMDPQFLNDQLTIADDYLYTREVLDFNRQVEHTFLPEIIRLCQENDIQLILVRMPIMRFYEPGTQPPGLDGYIRDMRAYLEQNGVYFLDFDRQDEFPEMYFEDLLHLNEAGGARFTELFIEALTPIIK